MKLLAIDTSTELMTVALATAEYVLCEEHKGVRQHAQFILPMIQNLFATTGLSLTELDGIVFGRGPGSFTGLRIACSVAKALAFAKDLPVYPVSSLLAIANEAYYVIEEDAQNTKVLAILDARMQELYWGCFTSDSIETSEHVTKASDIVVDSEASLVLAGVGFEPFVPLMPFHAAKIRQEIVYPRASAMIRLVQGGHISSVSAAHALPVYVRNQVTQGEARG